MPITKRSKLMQPPTVLLQDLEADAVLLNLVNGQYYGLDENSYHMYRVLLASETVQVAYESLLRNYAVEPGPLKADLEKFIEQLLENGLLIDADHQSQ